MKYWKTRIIIKECDLKSLTNLKISVIGFALSAISKFGYSLCKFGHILYISYLDNFTVLSCFSPLAHTFILISCILFFNLFSQHFSSSAVFLLALLVQSRYVVVWNARFHHQDYLGFVKHLINVYLLKACVCYFLKTHYKSDLII